MTPKEIGHNPKQIRTLPAKPGAKEITPTQGVLNLGIELQREIQGVGMGVLTDGTPFLTQRGLARLCGVENAHIGTISAEWSEGTQKPRITKIKDLLTSRGVVVDAPHIEVKDHGQIMYAYGPSLPKTIVLRLPRSFCC